MTSRGHRVVLTIVCGALALAPASDAGVVVYEKDGKKIELGGRIQLEYLRTDPDGGDSEDRVFLRRLRPYVAGTVTENWYGKIEFDFGEAEDAEEVALKDAYVQYLGWKDVKLTFGNSKTPFSREFLTSSIRQQTVERTFVGDHNFGAPDRQLGVKLEGRAGGRKRIAYALAAGAEHHDPDVQRLDFDTPANDRADWNEGVVLAGRVDFHPRGEVEFSQGDFDRGDPRFAFGLGAFTWSNDGDNDTYTSGNGESLSATRADLDRAEGAEISFALRGRGVSIDTQYNRVSGDTVVEGFTGGLYRDGSTRLDVVSAKGGFMLPEKPIEIVAAWESLDATSYQAAWVRTSLGVNYFWNRHNVKAQLFFRTDENAFGSRGADVEATFFLFQFVF